MKVYGLSQVNQKTVDEFDKHSDILALVRELMADPSKYKKLTDDAVKAIALVESEKKQRNEAIDIIEQSKQIQKETRNQLLELDVQKSAIEKTHKDSLRTLIDEKEKADAFLSEKKRFLDDKENKINALHADRENSHSSRMAELQTKEKKLAEDEVRIIEKTRELNRVHAEIEAFKARMA